MKIPLQLIGLAALWGTSFLFLRISSGEFGAFPLVFVRTGLAALTLIPWLLFSKQLSALVKHWRLFFFVGAMSTAVPFSFFAYTSQHMTAGYTSILNATTPFFSAMVAYFWLQERIGVNGILGLLLGFGGVYVLAMPSMGDGSVLSLLPIVAALCATFLYALSSSFVKRYLSDLNAITVTTGCQLSSAVLIFPLAWWFWPESNPSATAWWSAAGLAIFSTAMGLVIFFRLLQEIGVTKTVAVTYMIPVFAILWGWLFLGEVVTWTMFGGGCLVLFGVGLTTGVVESIRRLFRSAETDVEAPEKLSNKA